MDFNQLFSMMYLEPLLITLVAQQAEIAALKEKLSVDSKNSSKPPSSDFKRSKKKKVSKKKSGKKQGAQPGHKGVNRQLEPAANISKIVECKPDIICGCGADITHSSKYTRRQVYEINDNNSIFLTEYRVFKGCCRSCSKKYKGELPEILDGTIIGPALKAKMCALVSDFKLSKRDIKSLLKLFYNLDISLGTVSNTEARVSKALEQPYHKLAKSTKQQSNLNADETRSFESNKLSWAWIATNDSLTLLMLDKSRGKKAAKKLLGEDFAGILTTDRYAAYNIVDPSQRQLCWSHMTRDFIKISQRNSNAGTAGDELLFHQNKIFYYWNKYKSEIISFKHLKKAIDLIKKSFKSCLKNAINCGHTRTAGTCKNILKYFESLFTFSRHEGIEPTNNHAERQIRKYVIYRKLSYGTKSERGSRFIERIFSISATCKQQGKNIINYIKQAVINFNSGLPPPELLTA
jgi:transposase